MDPGDKVLLTLTENFDQMLLALALQDELHAPDRLLTICQPEWVQSLGPSTDTDWPRRYLMLYISREFRRQLLVLDIEVYGGESPSPEPDVRSVTIHLGCIRARGLYSPPVVAMPQVIGIAKTGALAAGFRLDLGRRNQCRVRRDNGDEVRVPDLEQLLGLHFL
jgi:hypothetical protein